MDQEKNVESGNIKFRLIIWIKNASKQKMIKIEQTKKSFKLLYKIVFIQEKIINMCIMLY